MATVLDICNLALAHLGDDATISALDEASVQAEQSNRYYPIARDTLLEIHTWNFAAKRASLSTVTNTVAQWEYAYAAPADMMTPIAILSPTAQSDYATRMSTGDTPGGITSNYSPTILAGHYTPQQFALEGTYIYTNQDNALLRYQAEITDSTIFSPLFVVTLSWQLAAMLAGPIIKGDQGRAEAKRCTEVMQGYLITAKQQDNLHRDIKVEHIVPWTSGR